MPDFNKVLDPGNYQEGLLNTVIEIPMGSAHKVEWDRQRAAFMLDRVEPKIFAKPVNYGFVPGTLDEDGDELDTLVVTEEPLPTGIWLEVKIVGIMNFEDDAEMDYKIVCVPSDDRNTGDNINTLADLGERWRQQVEYHFSHYKDLKKPGTTIVQSWGDAEEAKKIVKECIDRYQK